MKNASIRKCIYCGKPVEDKQIDKPGYIMQNLNFHPDCLAGGHTEVNDEDGEEFGPPGGFAPGWDMEKWLRIVFDTKGDRV